MWLESVDGRCWWRNVVVICCYCWVAIYSNLWELKLATLLKVTTYDFKADLLVTDSSGQALHDEKVTKCLHIQKLREILLQCYSKNIRFMEMFRLFEFCWVLFTFWGNLSSYLFGGRFPDRNNMWCFSEVSTAAPRYSSLEADEFDEGSAAEEADASVTRSSWSGGRFIFVWPKAYTLWTSISSNTSQMQVQIVDWRVSSKHHLLEVDSQFFFEDVTSPRPIQHVDFPCYMYQGSSLRTSYLLILDFPFSDNL